MLMRFFPPFCFWFVSMLCPLGRRPAGARSHGARFKPYHHTIEMAGMWNKIFSKKNEDDEYEARLTEIDTRIRRGERMMVELQRREAVSVTNLRWYGALLYLGYLTWYYLVVSRQEKQSRRWIVGTALILAIPVVYVHETLLIV